MFECLTKFFAASKAKLTIFEYVKIVFTPNRYIDFALLPEKVTKFNKVKKVAQIPFGLCNYYFSFAPF